MDDTVPAFSTLTGAKDVEKTFDIRGTGDRIALGALIALTGLVLYTIGVGVYRLWFHPLSKFPGPLFNKISDVSTRWKLQFRTLTMLKRA